MELIKGRIIGRGSTATVFIATDFNSGQLLAVKSSELLTSLFLQREQSILSKLDSPHIVKYIGFNVKNEQDKLMYNLCMEYVPGGTLYDVVLRHGARLEESMIRAYTRDILQGLNYLHNVIGLAHCDLKSKNVLIGSSGAKIADLGCARFVGSDSNLGFSGTPLFMAPEVARGEEQGFEADVWAVGCTVIEMATGKSPWLEMNDPVSALYRIGFSDEVPEVPEWLSEKGKDFLNKCLMKGLRERWTVKELLKHPFVDDQVDFTMISPNSVLDQAFWNSQLELPETPETLTFTDCSSLTPPASRIKKLITVAASNMPNWSTCDEDWITVRSNDIGEITTDTIDLLFEFSVENVSVIDNPNRRRVRDDDDEDANVLETCNFVTFNENSCLIQSNYFPFAQILLLSFTIFIWVVQISFSIDSGENVVAKKNLCSGQQSHLMSQNYLWV
ncbi:putative Mitogen-activated protein kinase kinase kinase [Tripterygium wilfordii]|uniref:Putative Mitogen-activated protein kinase kinase kinase n=1 Tax=Tripterygium wilfordii TaxID=458696 RepID=A0A7J7C9X3_TRIWF|nr:mitogen-activated protein kinase kinase kinase 18 [Tripterygium wilfordii]KAF5730536.1 putative Mitogen-activated protein kinase kinase kinase [Tripterygium wilfordii]